MNTTFDFVFPLFFFGLQFFTHPVVDTEMKRKWYGRDFMKSGWKRWRLLFSIWCFFDLVFSPLLYALCTLIHWQREKKRKRSKGKEII